MVELRFKRAIIRITKRLTSLSNIKEINKKFKEPSPVSTTNNSNIYYSRLAQHMHIP